MSKKKIKVEFWRKVKYYAEVEVSQENFELLQDADGDDIQQYLREEGKLSANPVYEILQDYAKEENECDWEGEFEDFEIMNNDE